MTPVALIHTVVILTALAHMPRLDAQSMVYFYQGSTISLDIGSGEGIQSFIGEFYGRRAPVVRKTAGMIK